MFSDSGQTTINVNHLDSLTYLPKTLPRVTAFGVTGELCVGRGRHLEWKQGPYFHLQRMFWSLKNP